jgi:hypothetical protein
MGKRRYNSTILDLDTRWTRVVSFTPLPLHLRGQRIRYPFDRRLGGLQSRSECCGEWKNLLHLTGIEPRSSSPSPSRCPIRRWDSEDLQLDVSMLHSGNITCWMRFRKLFYLCVTLNIFRKSKGLWRQYSILTITNFLALPHRPIF